jgi:hypothetical protein
MKYVSKRYDFPLFVSIVDSQISHLRTVNSVPDSGEVLNEHGSHGISRMKLPCSSMDSFH